MWLKNKGAVDVEVMGNRMIITFGDDHKAWVNLS
jgi:hypothetical protein